MLQWIDCYHLVENLYAILSLDLSYLKIQIFLQKKVPGSTACREVKTGKVQHLSHQSPSPYKGPHLLLYGNAFKVIDLLSSMGPEYWDYVLRTLSCTANFFSFHWESHQQNRGTVHSASCKVPLTAPAGTSAIKHEVITTVIMNGTHQSSF